jgi:hypothetical protein
MSKTIRRGMAMLTWRLWNLEQYVQIKRLNDWCKDEFPLINSLKTWRGRGRTLIKRIKKLQLQISFKITVLCKLNETCIKSVKNTEISYVQLVVLFLFLCLKNQMKYWYSVIFIFCFQRKTVKSLPFKQDVFKQLKIC